MWKSAIYTAGVNPATSGKRDLDKKKRQMNLRRMTGTRVKDFANDAWEKMKRQILVQFFVLCHARVTEWFLKC